MPVKNIIFDLGAVILDIDYAGPSKVLKEYGVSDFEAAYSKARQDNTFDLFEKGQIDNSEFREAFKKYAGLSLSDKEADDIWNTIILDFPKARIGLLLALKKQYRTYLLSNTNAIHYVYYTEALYNNYGLTWDTLLHKAYFSFEMGMRKPDKEIFLKALENSKLNPEETLFIDDLSENVNAARECGLKTIHLIQGTDITDIFYADSNQILHIKDAYINF